MKRRKYEIGDQLVVTGDTVQWKHHFAVDTEVTVVGFFDYGGRVGYTVQGMHANKSRGIVPFNVCEVDLKRAFEPVTDDELAEVYKMLGASDG